jgi:alpha-tubulin suppressor-like RCC1 family protein
MRSRFSALAAFGALALLVGCSDGPTGPVGQDLVPLRVSANVAGTPVTVLTITVTADDIPTPLVFNLHVANGLATGTVNVSPGPARTFTARAFESLGQITHEGSATVDVLRGPNPPLNIPMVPRGGQVPITVTVAEVSVVLVPASMELMPGDTWRPTVLITDAEGRAVEGAEPTWASANPAIAVVDETGLVTAVAVGETQIVAVFAGVAGLMWVNVVDAPFAWAGVTTGGAHTCGLAPSGEAYCWGFNGYGQLGDGTTTNRNSPLAVAGGLTFQQLIAGLYHTCGLTPSGEAYCWGHNSAGQLGDETRAARTSPVAVTGGLTFQQLAGGAWHSCGLTPSGEAYCWGSNGAGQVGDGTNDNSYMAPVAVTGGLTFQQLAGGGWHSCGLTQSGEAYCWGWNESGELGDGTTTQRLTPVAVTGGLNFQRITSEGSHTCGLISSGEAYCWGRNHLGQLGDGTSTDRTSPVAVTGGLTFQQLAGGAWHSCGLTVSGEAHCWGNNVAGELGDGTTEASTAPVPVAGGLAFQQVGAGGNHSCAVTTLESMYCWGANGAGQLGDGTTDHRLVPVRVRAPMVAP